MLLKIEELKDSQDFVPKLCAVAIHG